MVGRKQEPQATTGPCPQCPGSTPNPPILTICNIAMRRPPPHSLLAKAIGIDISLREALSGSGGFSGLSSKNQQPQTLTTTTTNDFNFLQPNNTTTSIAVTSFQRTTDEEFVMTPKLLFLVLLLGLGCQEVIMQ